MKPFKIADVEDRMKAHGEANGVTIAGDDVYMDYPSLGHARRDSKVRNGKDVSVEDLADFPSQMEGMDLYFDSEKRNYIYSKGRNKYIIDPNRTIKIDRERMKRVVFVTASRAKDGETFEFVGDQYKKIER